MSPSERKERSRGMGSMTNRPPPGQLEDAYDDNAAPAPDHPDESGGGETATIPIALLGGKQFKPGEEVVFKIVNLNEKDGTATIAYATGHGESEEPGGEMEHPAVRGMPEGE